MAGARDHDLAGVGDRFGEDVRVGGRHHLVQVARDDESGHRHLVQPGLGTWVPEAAHELILVALGRGGDLEALGHVLLDAVPRGRLGVADVDGGTNGLFERERGPSAQHVHHRLVGPDGVAAARVGAAQDEAAKPVGVADGHLLSDDPAE